MPLTEEMQEVIVVGDLIRQKVTLVLESTEAVVGVVNSISNHGVLIKTEYDTHELYPWHIIVCVMKGKKKEIEKKESIEIVETDYHTIQNLLPSDYDLDIIREDLIEVYDEDGDESIWFDPTSKKINLIKEKDLDLAKSIARAFKIKKIVREYE